MKAKIIIVDDHALFREVMRLLIETEEIGEVMAEAENGRVFLDLLDHNLPDLVLMDLEMPVMGGLEATIKALAARPELKILMLTMPGRKHDYEAMINAGARGFVLKTAGKHYLEKAIKTLLVGENYFFSDPFSNDIVIKSGKH
jgi:DNA-binding NarL/FixJ family response regulator